MSDADICMRCGACCACFRVAFPSAESDDVQGGCVPMNLSVPIDAQRRAMRGTEGRAPRCAALEGQVGLCVCCTIYGQRPSTCRAFDVDWTAGRHNPICSRARATFGLSPLEPF